MLSRKWDIKEVVSLGWVAVALRINQVLSDTRQLSQGHFTLTSFHHLAYNWRHIGLLGAPPQQGVRGGSQQRQCLWHATILSQGLHVLSQCSHLKIRWKAAGVLASLFPQGTRDCAKSLYIASGTPIGNSSQGKFRSYQVFGLILHLFLFPVVFPVAKRMHRTQ